MNNIETYVSAKEYSLVAEIFSEIEAKEAVSLLLALNEEDFLAVCRAFKAEILAKLLPFFDKERLALLIEDLNYSEIKEIFSEIEPEDKVTVLKALSPDLAVRVLAPEDVGAILHLIDYQVLKAILAEMNGVDAARALERVEETDLPLLFRLLPKDLAAEAFAELPFQGHRMQPLRMM